MNISHETLTKAVQSNIISSSQLDQLIELNNQLPNNNTSSGLSYLLYYFGGLVAIGAMSLFLNLTWTFLGGWGLVLLSLVYALIGLSLTSIFQHRKLAIPAGICATFVICLTPLALYGLLQGCGWWSLLAPHWSGIISSLSTVLIGLTLLWMYRYPFMIMPISLSLWYLSMELGAVLYNNDSSAQQINTSIYFGLSMVLVAFFVDRKTASKEDFAFWLYLFGALSFWIGLTFHFPHTELANFLYFVVNLVLIFISLFLNRKIFLLLGGIGVSLYVGHLAFDVFENSFWFPISLSAIGFAIMYLGVFGQTALRKRLSKIRSK